MCEIGQPLAFMHQEETRLMGIGFLIINLRDPQKIRFTIDFYTAVL